jgi:hypothetical protein
MKGRLKMMIQSLLAAGFATSLAMAAGGSGGGGAAVPGVAEVRVFNETIPAGGTVQIKLGLTNPRPIMGGSGDFYSSDLMDAFFGIAVFSPAGDAFGVAGVSNGKVSIHVVSPLASMGTSDYPFVTIAGHVRGDAAAGSTMPLSVTGSFLDPAGTTVALAPKPGVLTVGGSLAVHNIVPGGGVWPAGTVVRVLGAGFGKGTALNRASFKVSGWRIVSPSEIDLTLGEQVEMEHQFVMLSNPDKSTITYYAYLRGVETVASSVPIVASSMPMFPGLTYSQMQIQQNSRGMNNNLVTALSLQNPNPTAAIVSLEAETPATGKIAETTITLAFGEKITRELGEFFGLQLNPGTTVKVRSSLPVQSVGFVADPGTGAVAPFVPSPF